MKILVENYKNINRFEYDVKDNMVNFIFGLSGVGKSALTEALIDNEPILNQKIGVNKEPVILLDQLNPNKESIAIFNENCKIKYFSETANEYVYDVFIDDEEAYDKVQRKLYEDIRVLQNAIDLENDQYDKYIDILENTGAYKLSAKGEIKATSAFKKVYNAVVSEKGNKILKKLIELPDGKLDWIIKGSDYINNNKCPYCEKRLSRRMVEKYSKYKSYTSKNLSSITKAHESYLEIDDNATLTITGLKSFEKELIKYSNACHQYEILKQFIEDVKKMDKDACEIEPLILNDDFCKVFRNVAHIANKMFRNIDVLKKTYDNTLRNTKNIMRNKTKGINRNLDRLSIPYEVVAKYNQKKITEYKICHKEDISKSDSKRRLSTGEKNIISLLLFLETIKGTSKSLIIIDDPVSSYDEYRRSQLTNVIVDKCKGITTLVLSHDSIFAKYACISRSNNIGNIDYIEKRDEHIVATPVSKNEFGNMQEFLQERIELSTDYYQKIINARMLYEGTKKNHHCYQYLSAILHKVPRDNIEKLLNDIGKSENDILERINKEHEVIIPPLKDEYYNNICYDNYSFFEKAIYLREFKNTYNLDKIIIDELNDYVHLNNRLHITLNPYKYIMTSKIVYDAVINNVK